MSYHLDPSPDRAAFLWKQAIEDLRTECNPGYPVTVVRRVLKQQCALCVFEKSRFRLTIDSNASFQHQLDLLLHEWAHAMSWFAPELEKTDHPDEWGLCLSRCYRAVMHD